MYKYRLKYEQKDKKMQKIIQMDAIAICSIIWAKNDTKGCTHTCLSRSTTPSPIWVNSPGAFSPQSTWKSCKLGKLNTIRLWIITLGLVWSGQIQIQKKNKYQYKLTSKFFTLGLILARTKADESSIHWFALLSDPRFWPVKEYLVFGMVYFVFGCLTHAFDQSRDWGYEEWVRGGRMMWLWS